jgi:arylsulfatase A-like enzyme
VITPLAAHAAGERPNVLLILSDDHAAPHLGCLGDPNVRTPHLDQLAAEGLKCHRFYVSTPQCVPSRATYLTGRSPVGIQMTRFSAPLPRDVITFPEVLRDAGYHTGLGGRTFHLDGDRQSAVSEPVFQEFQLRTFADRVDWLNKESNPEQAVRLVSEFLDSVPSGKPFFLQFCFSDPHRPFTAQSVSDPPDPGALKLPGHFPDTQLVREDLAGYYEEVQRLDSNVGRLLRLLDERDLRDETIVLFAGDNGAALLRGKGTLYEFGIRVPLLVRWPGVVAPGRSADVLLSNEDIGPTILDAAGVAVPRTMTGQSFLTLLRGDQFTGRTYAFSQRGAHGSSLPRSTSAFDLNRSVVSRRYKLIYNVLPKLPYAPVDFNQGAMWQELQAGSEQGTLPEPFRGIYFPAERPMFELYDLASDPAELHNLAGTGAVADVEQELLAALQRWMILERDFVPLPSAPPPR